VRKDNIFLIQHKTFFTFSTNTGVFLNNMQRQGISASLKAYVNDKAGEIPLWVGFAKS